ncbi:4-hydroxy-3-methylbut-2-enyl diphosphate reductase [Acididesulfobacillus acetoxydans]|uniref:4-hydroxy-3-methylbut-2-enyl diphosphate reductase n=1 Tax=Acididesulfobacillus acetoxydans TaxID=1561005 RepID=A0A8S0WGN4_9FIRM|nr:bifunctional 4-hydroxy-3-methylbut-2-enyl diphosphate reductase/30S ribosomal protein S1 [Acididesulfobacillus acetoxydans]CAA7602032.1 4-hydroxy-3-methylbut-2-enyl diphosphate reductase [Acididesulfobacillus acetoxydans]CEJ08125.1 4-hydroxy-3-methylbut-2-enyl diphosphate reductase [Acididesulfobacillus acetoxydans]
MRVIRAAKAGFCFGVKRALELAERTAGVSETVSLGPLIHNQQVVERMAEKGLRVVDTLDGLGRTPTLIVRSHGLPPSVYETARRAAMEIVDATCPFVQKAQRLAAEAAEVSQVIVVGDKNHPEVQGILGWAGPRAIAIEKLEEARELPYFSSLAVLAQTTQPAENFRRIVSELENHTDSLTVHNTICNATEERQTAARELAKTVDVMVVAGGRNSANTRKLADICAGLTRTYLIETAVELQKIWFAGAVTAGLTAGASTPDWIIEEVYRKMAEMNEMDSQTMATESVREEEPAEETAADLEHADLEHKERNMESWDEGLQGIHRGALVSGTVVKITDDEVFVDIGWKSEGVISLRELSVAKVHKPEEVVSLGDSITALVLRVENEEGYPVLSKRRAGEMEAVQHLEEVYENKGEIRAKVAEVVKGGLLVDVGMRGFVPASQIQLNYVEDLNQFLGQTLRLRIIDFDRDKKKVVLSQKVILGEEQSSKRAHLLETLQEGETVQGIVRRLTSFGAFVDIGGIDGLLHVSDMAYSRVKHPSEIVQVGEEIEVRVLRIDRENGKISLGLKQLKESPWASAAEKYPVGSMVSGKVVRLAPFGAFVQLEDGIDALIHISQLADHRIAKVEDAVQVGDMISAKVIEVKAGEKRISLSIREALNEAAARNNAEALAAQEDVAPVTIGEALSGTPAEERED